MTLLTVIELPVVPPNSFYSIVPGSLGGMSAEVTSDYQYSAERLLTQAKTYLTNMIVGLKASTDVEIEHLTEIGDPASMIVKTAEMLKVDAIVMSTHGRSGISRWLFGSVTSKVLSAAPCPVFVIPSIQRQHKLEQNAPEMNYG
jgi:nucleotide-binding universal stress UspA family protein